MAFQRAISPLGLLFAGISSVIGSGWLFGPLFAAQIAGPAAVVSWIFGGVLMIIIALTFAELGSAFPVAGGMIQFATRSHGPLMGFTVGWMVWISSVAVAPVETLGIIHYASNYVPGLLKKVNNVNVLSYLGMGFAAIVMWLMCVLNYYGAKFFNRSNNIITSIKLIVPIATVILLIGYHFHPANFHSANAGFFVYGFHGVLAALPLGGVIYSFIGSNTILQLAAETRNPQKSIPMALIGSMTFCVLLYTLLQVAFIGALLPDSFSAGWNKLSYADDNGPFVGIIEALGLSWFVVIIYADAFISPFGTGFVFTAATARVGYGLSEIGFLPKSLLKLTAKGVPFRNIFLNYCVGLLLFLPFPVWQSLVSFIVSCFIVSYIIGPLSLITLRKKEPTLSRPFLLPHGYLVALLGFYICNLLIFWTGWQTVSKMMVVLLIGLGFYLFYLLREKNKNGWRDCKPAIWLFPYFIMLSLISYLGTFGGGKNVIPFGIDFIVIGILTMIIFHFSLKNASTH